MIRNMYKNYINCNMFNIKWLIKKLFLCLNLSNIILIYNCICVNNKYE